MSGTVRYTITSESATDSDSRPFFWCQNHTLGINNFFKENILLYEKTSIVL